MRQRLTDEQLQAIRAERHQAGTVIETLKAAFAVPGVTAEHPQLQPYLQVLLTNPQVPKLTWMSAIRFAGYEPVLAARYPGAEKVVIAMRDACQKAGYVPDRVDWKEFRAAVSRGLTHEEWEALMKQLPELPKREKRANPALATATSLAEFFAAQQQPREDDDEDDEEEKLTPAQQIRLTLAGAEPARTPTAAPLSSLPALDIKSLMPTPAGSHAAAVSPATAQPASVSAMPDLTKVLGANGGTDPKTELKFKLELAKAEGKDVDMLLKFVDSNPDGVRKLAAAKGIAV